MKRAGVTNLAAESALITQPSPHSFERVNVLKKTRLNRMETLCFIS